MAYKVFIDGQAGTTGLRLADRLSLRDDIELVQIEEEKRKDIGTRLSCMAEADVAFLCLPDEEAAVIVAEAENTGLNKIKIIDCSTKHRVAPGWKYGIPELFSIATEDKKIANPGCHATGFIMSIKPLVDAGIVDKDSALSCHSLTGYSGGGKSMIAAYEEAKSTNAFKAPRQYALSQQHKHLPEMKEYSELSMAPVFSPIVCDFYSGMLVGVPIHRQVLQRGVSVADVREELARFYEGSKLVKIRPADAESSEDFGGGLLAANAFENRDDIEIFVCGNDDRIEIVSRYDNLGKGASGAAIQNMNLVLGMPEEKGLVIGD
jgi:N-acetyl-gamma-glutamyl-phosphate reductase, uncommon form